MLTLSAHAPAPFEFENTTCRGGSPEMCGPVTGGRTPLLLARMPAEAFVTWRPIFAALHSFSRLAGNPASPCPVLCTALVLRKSCVRMPVG